MPGTKPPAPQALTTVEVVYEESLDCVTMRVFDPSDMTQSRISFQAHLDDLSKPSTVTEELLSVLRPVLRAALRPAFEE